MKFTLVRLACLVCFGLVACGGQNKKDDKPADSGPAVDEAEGSFLYVIQAGKAFLRQEGEHWVLRLVDTDPQALAFSDRPERIAGNIETRRLLAQWAMSAHENPPNVAMVHEGIANGPMRVVAPSATKERNPAIALELDEPEEVDPDGYRFTARVLAGQDYMLEEGVYREVSLFVDDFQGVLDCSLCVYACAFSFGLGCHTKSPGCQCCSDGKTCPSNVHPTHTEPQFKCDDSSTYPGCVTWSRSGGCYNCPACFKSRKWCSSGGGSISDGPPSDPNFKCDDSSTYPGCVTWSRSGGCYNCPACFKSRKWCSSDSEPTDMKPTICSCNAGYYGDKCQYKGCDPRVDCRGASSCNGTSHAGPGDDVGNTGHCTNYSQSCDCSGVIAIDTGSGDGCGSYECRRIATGKATPESVCSNDADPCCGNGTSLDLP